ncbi:MAG TPA: FAD-dependent oxidoreductase [Acidimicrobiales bacterium]|jgi:fumarate reductase flavoprotein subunit|nr:FAD-dependent oxidoreductase [Acidimicrobiales bacterium]
MSPGQDQLDADVVVLGSGAAGLMAAVEAAEAGRRTVVVEKEPEIGGSTRLSGGYLALCETELQPGTRAELLEDLRASHRYDADEALSQLYVDEAPAMYRRLVALGLRFAGTMQFANMSKAWGHELPLGQLGGGAQIVEHLAAAAAERSVRVLTATPARRLLREGDGPVIGVAVERDGQTVEMAAADGVVLATGGFTRNPALVKTYGRPGTEAILPITGPGSQGDGLVMATALGAATSYIGRGVAPTTPVEPATGKGCVVNYAGGILLNKEGHRFCDESAVYVDLCWAGLAQTDHFMVQVFDEVARADYATTMVGQVMSGGETYRADTVADLMAQVAAGTGLDPVAAVDTVDRYNRSVDAGHDEVFGRTHLIGTDGALRRIETPPFAAIVVAPGTTHFNGGLEVDADLRVIDVFGQPIPGLYAAGELTGGFHGSGYMPATHVGSALIFGRRAGIGVAAGRR